MKGIRIFPLLLYYIFVLFCLFINSMSPCIFSSCCRYRSAVGYNKLQILHDRLINRTSEMAGVPYLEIQILDSGNKHRQQSPPTFLVFVPKAAPTNAKNKAPKTTKKCIFFVQTLTAFICPRRLCLPIKPKSTWEKKEIDI